MRSISLLIVVVLCMSFAALMPAVKMHCNPHGQVSVPVLVMDVCQRHDGGTITGSDSNINWIFEHCCIVLQAGESDFQRPLYNKIKPLLYGLLKNRPPIA